MWLIAITVPEFFGYVEAFLRSLGVWEVLQAVIILAAIVAFLRAFLRL